MAVASVQENKPIPFHTVVIGEVGLAGEVRPVSALGRRVAEAKRLGFRHAVIPAARADREDLPDGIRITRVTNLGEAVNACLFDGPPATF
jgi:DNA repair protein RadA/Sms